MRIKTLLIAIFSLCISTSWATSNPAPIETGDSILERPLIERYILDELKATRHDLQDLERRLTIEITDRELSVATHSLAYAEQTVNYFFYIIAGVASLIALFGWKSLYELRVNTTKKANSQIRKIAESYEEKFKTLEKELLRKTRRIADNHIEIEKINEIHNLWLRAQKSPTPEQKMEAYDGILKIRPGDLEALTSKADAAMAMQEFHWALSICNRVLDVDDKNHNAFYQRACAYACLGVEEQAINDLEKAIHGRSALRDLAVEESDFESLRMNDKFNALLCANEN